MKEKKSARLPNGLRPVRQIELNEKHIKPRAVLVIALLVVAVAAIAYGLRSLTVTEPGWYTIESDASAGVSCADDFVFSYQVGTTTVPARTELQNVSRLYTTATAAAFRLFDAYTEYEGVNNLAKVNHHWNEKVQIDPALYAALSQAAESRYLYLAPWYQEDWALFHAQSDGEAAECDPERSAEEAAFRIQSAKYLNDPEAVRLELLGNSTVELHVSGECAAFAEEYGVTDLVDFGWMKNAFIADYLADRMLENGFTRGSISSYDGFSRNLDAGREYALNLFSRSEKGTARQSALLTYTAPCALTAMRAFRVDAREAYYYRWQDGSFRSGHLDPRDGLSRDAFDSLAAASESLGCGEMLLRLLPAVIADQADPAALEALAGRDMAVAFWESGVWQLTGDETMVKMKTDGP